MKKKISLSRGEGWCLNFYLAMHVLINHYDDKYRLILTITAGSVHLFTLVFSRSKILRDGQL